MVVKITMQASPLEGTDKGRSVEIIRNPRTFTLNSELREHLYEVLKVFFDDEDALMDFLGMDRICKKECACDDVLDYEDDFDTVVPVDVNGKKCFVAINRTSGKRRVPVIVNNKQYMLSVSLDES